VSDARRETLKRPILRGLGRENAERIAVWALVLVLLSGIGPADHLRSHGIDVVAARHRGDPVEPGDMVEMRVREHQGIDPVEPRLVLVFEQ